MLTESAYTYDPLGQLTGFAKSTGYGERYAYDKAGNMLQKVITGEAIGSASTSSTLSSVTPAAVTLKMQYNKANQLISMANGQDRIAYSYDKNGSMVKKVLTSKAYGTLIDTYTYNALDQLTSYMGYDGYQQQLTYDANGMRLTKKEAGNGNRSTLEELLRGNIARLPEVMEPAKSQTNKKDDSLPAEPEWATTEYLYDLTQEYYQVIEEKTTGKSGTSKTAYAYGLERIAAYSVDKTGITGKTSYVYDGRGSVAQTVDVPVAGQKVQSALPETQVKVQSFSYTAFGEQMGRKVSGFGYNAEAFDAVTGMINLRARQYEPTMGRFGQKDAVYGNNAIPQSLHRYTCCFNNCLMLFDPSGQSPQKSSLGAFSSFYKTTVSSAVKTASKTIASVKKAMSTLVTAMNKGYKSARYSSDPVVREAYTISTKEIQRRKENGNPVSAIKEDEIFVSACSLMAIQLANEYGSGNTSRMSETEAKNIQDYARYANYKTSRKVKESINDSRAKADRLPSTIKATSSKSPVCAGYIYNSITLKGTNMDVSELATYLIAQKRIDPKVGNTTTPQFAAFTGGITRSSNLPKNGSVLAPVVKATISISSQEDITIKLPGETEYITLNGTDALSYSDQWHLLNAAGVINANDIVYMGDGQTNRYIDMYHVGMMDSKTTYSGQNLAVIDRSIFEEQILKNENTKTVQRLYFILLNSP